jgi:hypothetical protein
LQVNWLGFLQGKQAGARVEKLLDKEVPQFLSMWKNEGNKWRDPLFVGLELTSSSPVCILAHTIVYTKVTVSYSVPDDV